MLTMSKPQCLLVPILLCCASFAQIAEPKEHAPTLEQCRIDASRWMAQPISKKDWSVEAIVSAAKEMLYCDITYQQDSAQFALLEHQLQDVIAARYQHFLERHGLFQLFLDEDAKGER